MNPLIATFSSSQQISYKWKIFIKKESCKIKSFILTSSSTLELAS